jgi:lysophospholipase L1-like esterase
MKKNYLIRVALFVLAALMPLEGQSPYSVNIFKPATPMTATNQTSSAIPLGTVATLPKGGSYSLCTITLTGSSLTTATFGVLGSADNGVTYVPILIWAIATPGTTATTATATAAGAYQFNCGALTHVKYVTSGTFTATSISLLLTASPNAQVAQAAGGSGTQTAALLAQIPQNGLIGFYTHTDCTNPYADYSGAGNTGAAINGVTQPTCSNNGLTYPGSAVNAWAPPAAVAANALTYIFSILPYQVAGYVGPQNQQILGSSSTGLTLNFFSTSGLGNPTLTWSPQMGTTSVYFNTNSFSVMPSASIMAYEIGTGVAGDVDQMFVNGLEVPYHFHGATTLAAANVGTLQIGGASGTGWYFMGVESVTAVYNRKLTAAEQVQVSGALANFTQVRTGQMYPVANGNSQNSQITCDGDSITEGIGVPHPWCSTNLMSVGETIGVTNTATSGKLLSSIATRAPQEIIQYISPVANKNTVYIAGGSNDLAAGDTGQQTWNFGSTAAARAKAGSSAVANVRLVMWPVLSRTGVDTAKDSYNPVFNEQCPQVADYCIAGDDPLLFADNAYSNAGYFQADGIHPNTAGQTIMAGYASNAYEQLYGSTLLSPTQVSASTYTVLASDNFITVTANSVITLYNCLGYSHFVHVKVLPGLTVTVKNATSAQTIDGVDHSSSALSLTAGNNYQFQVVPGAASTGGCTWIIN